MRLLRYFDKQRTSFRSYSIFKFLPPGVLVKTESGPGADATTACGPVRMKGVMNPRPARKSEAEECSLAEYALSCPRRVKRHERQTEGPVTRCWQHRYRHKPQGRENQHIPVPQGERGILWAWSGQLSHLPPPAVSIMAPVKPQEA